MPGGTSDRRIQSNVKSTSICGAHLGALHQEAVQVHAVEQHAGVVDARQALQRRGFLLYSISITHVLCCLRQESAHAGQSARDVTVGE